MSRASHGNRHGGWKGWAYQLLDENVSPAEVAARIDAHARQSRRGPAPSERTVRRWAAERKQQPAPPPSTSSRLRVVCAEAADADLIRTQRPHAPAYTPPAPDWDRALGPGPPPSREELWAAMNDAVALLDWARLGLLCAETAVDEPTATALEAFGKAFLAALELVYPVWPGMET